MRRSASVPTSVPTSVIDQREDAQLVISEEPRLVISVPKRLVRLAVRRNTVKRVARESWRHAAAADRARLRPPAILVRLIRSPMGVLPGTAGPAGATTVAGAPAPSAGPVATVEAVANVAKPGRKGRRAAVPVAPPLPLTTFKRLLRADLDAIWAGRFRPSNRHRRGPSAPTPASASARSPS